MLAAFAGAVEDDALAVLESAEPDPDGVVEEDDEPSVLLAAVVDSFGVLSLAPDPSAEEPARESVR